MISVPSFISPSRLFLSLPTLKQKPKGARHLSVSEDRQPRCLMPSMHFESISHPMWVLTSDESMLGWHQLSYIWFCLFGWSFLNLNSILPNLRYILMCFLIHFGRSIHKEKVRWHLMPVLALLPLQQSHQKYNWFKCTWRYPPQVPMMAGQFANAWFGIVKNTKTYCTFTTWL